VEIGLERLGQKDQPAEGMIDSGKILLKVEPALNRRIKAWEHVDKAEESDTKRFVFQGPVDHAPQPILGFEERRFVLADSAVEAARQLLYFPFSFLRGFRRRHFLL